VAVIVTLVMVALAGVNASSTPLVIPQVAPNLRPVNPAMTPVPTREGDIVEVTVAVANIGDTAAVYATVDLTDSRPNGKIVWSGRPVISDPLAPDASTVVHMQPFLAIGVGEHTLTIHVGNVTPAEADGGNNDVSIGMDVLSPKASPPPPPSDGGVRAQALETLGLGAIVGFVLVVLGIGLVVGLLARREPYEVVPPPPEPPDRSPPPIWPP